MTHIIAHICWLLLSLLQTKLCHLSLWHFIHKSSLSQESNVWVIKVTYLPSTDLLAIHPLFAPVQSLTAIHELVARNDPRVILVHGQTLKAHKGI